MTEEDHGKMIEVCWWCGDDWPISDSACRNCGNTAREKPTIDWNHVEQIFPGGMPSCGLTDAALLGGSNDDAPASGTIYLNS